MDPSDNSFSVENQWAVTVPARVTAITLTEDVLFFAGAPWTGRPDDDAAALLAEENGGLLGAVDPANGKSLAQYQLPSAPAWDGMAAAPGRLYISTRDGRVLCMGNKANSPGE